MVKTNTLGALAAAAGVLVAVGLLILIMLVVQPRPAEATFPGQNGRIAFAANSFGIGRNDEIYTMPPDGSDWRQLTSTTDGARYPAWSADGTKIAFNVVRQGSHEIGTMYSDGSGRRLLTPIDGIPSNQPVWSPDGTKIAFWSYYDGQKADIFVMNADGSGVKRLTTDPEHHDAAPAWSPDGTKIAFQKGLSWLGDTHEDVWVMDASDGTGQANLTSDLAANAGNGNPDWSPDGTKIAFASSGDIYTVNPNGSSLSPLTNTTDMSEWSPAWSPDGTQIVFNAWDPQIGDVDLWKMLANGTNRTNLTNNGSTIREADPDWQPKPTDNTAPKVVSTIPSRSDTEVASTTNVWATFSERMDRNTINDTTFKLVKLNADGTTTRVTATVSYAAPKKASLDPASDLSSGTIYKVTVTTGAQDLAGNALDQNPQIEGNQTKSWKFTVQ